MHINNFGKSLYLKKEIQSRNIGNIVKSETSQNANDVILSTKSNNLINSPEKGNKIAGGKSNNCKSRNMLRKLNQVFTTNDFLHSKNSEKLHKIINNHLANRKFFYNKISSLIHNKKQFINNHNSSKLIKHIKRPPIINKDGTLNIVSIFNSTPSITNNSVVSTKSNKLFVISNEKKSLFESNNKNNVAHVMKFCINSKNINNSKPFKTYCLSEQI